MGIPLAKTCGFAKEVPSDKVNDQVPGDEQMGLRVEDGYGFLVSLPSIWCGHKVSDLHTYFCGFIQKSMIVTPDKPSWKLSDR